MFVTGLDLKKATGYALKGHKTISKKQCVSKIRNFKTLGHFILNFLGFSAFLCCIYCKTCFTENLNAKLFMKS